MATLNGETSGFTSKQRNILPSNILSRFRTISFSEIQYLECNQIFDELVPSDIENHQQITQNIADIHTAISKYHNIFYLNSFSRC
jgi:hypothetical protein